MRAFKTGFYASLIGGGLLAGCAPMLPRADYAAPPEAADKTERYDPLATRQNFGVAAAILAFRQTMRDGSDLSGAREILIERLPNKSFTVLDQDNATAALVVYDRAQKKITVAFNAGDAWASVLNDLHFWRTPHPLGGLVHSGFYDAINSKNVSGESLIERIKQTVDRYAKDEAGPVDLAFTGFSRGGALALAAMAQMMAEGYPAAGSNIKLASLYEIASPPFGNDRFLERFAANARKDNISVWRILGAGDAIPQQMTADAWYMLNGGLYGQAGNKVYLVASKTGTAPLTVLVNPQAGMLTDVMKQSNAGLVLHNQDSYAELLGVPEARMPKRPVSAPRAAPAGRLPQNGPP